jgi:DNA modification methylase
VFREVRRVLRDDGTLWLNLGDSYANQKSGDTYSGFNDRYFGRDTDGGKQAKTVSSANVGRLEFSNLKPKDLVGIPWRVAFALQADGWWLRQDIIWHKPNPMPESVTDRCTKAHEYVFLLTKSARYYYDAEAIREPWTGPAAEAVRVGEKQVGQRGISPSARRGLAEGQATQFSKKGHSGYFGADGKCLLNPAGANKRSVWRVATRPYKGAHFAVMPAALVEPCILAGTSEEGCCPYCGAPWARLVEKRREPTRPGNNSKVYIDPPVADGSPLRSHAGDVCGNRDPQRHCTVTSTKGWQATCDCPEHRPERCTVLDPFAGSGTTLAVAARLGRHGIGCELNPEYIALAEKRIAEATEKEGLFA